MCMAIERGLRVTVVHSPGAGQVSEEQLELPWGSTVADALRLSGMLKRWPELTVESPTQIGIWGHRVQADHRLREGDRVELYRRLSVDPKVSRRERFSRQGARTTGLFSRHDTDHKAH